MEINGVLIDSAALGMGGTNCYIVRKKDSDKAVVIDPGDSGAQLAHFIQEKGMKVESILLTHGHYDHILGVEDLMRDAGGKLCASDEEAELLGDPSLNLTVMVGGGKSLEAETLLHDGQLYETAGMKFRILHTPGHTRGSCCYYLEEEEILFSGDTLFLESVGRADLPTGNEETLIRSLREKVLVLPETVKVFPGHGPATKIGYERENNPYVGMEL